MKIHVCSQYELMLIYATSNIENILILRNAALSLPYCKLLLKKQLYNSEKSKLKLVSVLRIKKNPVMPMPADVGH